MINDLEFETLMNMAKEVLERAGQTFDDGDAESDRYAAFLHACLSEAARRTAVRNIPKPEVIFGSYVEFWKAVQAGEDPPPPTFRVIKGGRR